MTFSSLSSIRKVYDNYAWFYDVAFGQIFKQGRSVTTDLVNKNAAQGAKVIELGVGTGLSLPLYRRDLNITGIDISENMLKKAQERVQENHLGAKVSLKVMDAANLDFPDASFDFVVAMYVASVVPDPRAFFDEITRVCKPAGEIIFVNHFASDKPALRFIEKKLAGVQNIIGFNSNFCISTVLDYKQFQLINSYKTNLFGYWKILHCKRA